jgi:hypothetical protein
MPDNPLAAALRARLAELQQERLKAQGLDEITNEMRLAALQTLIMDAKHGADRALSTDAAV